jgi:hypothetical protein
MPWRYRRGAEVYLHSFLTSSLDGEWLTSGPGRLTLWKERRYTLSKSLHGTPKPGLDSVGLENPVSFSPQHGHYTDCAPRVPAGFVKLYY